jgi:hypothetical protein
MRRREFTLGGWAAVSGPRAASAFAESDMAKIQVYEVFKGDRPVLPVSDEPEALVSTALPPPEREPVSHPFLGASTHAPEEEPALRENLGRAVDFRISSRGCGKPATRPANERPRDRTA